MGPMQATVTPRRSRGSSAGVEERAEAPHRGGAGEGHHVHPALRERLAQARRVLGGRARAVGGDLRDVGARARSARAPARRGSPPREGAARGLPAPRSGRRRSSRPSATYSPGTTSAVSPHSRSAAAVAGPMAASRLRSSSARPCPVASIRRRTMATPLTLVNTTQSCSSRQGGVQGGPGVGRLDGDGRHEHHPGAGRFQQRGERPGLLARSGHQDHPAGQGFTTPRLGHHLITRDSHREPPSPPWPGDRPPASRPAARRRRPARSRSPRSVVAPSGLDTTPVSARAAPSRRA